MVLSFNFWSDEKKKKEDPIGKDTDKDADEETKTGEDDVGKDNDMNKKTPRVDNTTTPPPPDRKRRKSKGSSCEIRKVRERDTGKEGYIIGGRYFEDLETDVESPVPTTHVETGEEGTHSTLGSGTANPGGDRNGSPDQDDPTVDVTAGSTTTTSATAGGTTTTGTTATAGTRNAATATTSSALPNKKRPTVTSTATTAPARGGPKNDKDYEEIESSDDDVEDVTPSAAAPPTTAPTSDSHDRNKRRRDITRLADRGELVDSMLIFLSDSRDVEDAMIKDDAEDFEVMSRAAPGWLSSRVRDLDKVHGEVAKGKTKSDGRNQLAERVRNMKEQIRDGRCWKALIGNELTHGRMRGCGQYYIVMSVLAQTGTIRKNGNANVRFHYSNKDIFEMVNGLTNTQFEMLDYAISEAEALVGDPYVKAKYT